MNNNKEQIGKIELLEQQISDLEKKNEQITQDVRNLEKRARKTFILVGYSIITLIVFIWVMHFYGQLVNSYSLNGVRDLSEEYKIQVQERYRHWRLIFGIVLFSITIIISVLYASILLPWRKKKNKTAKKNTLGVKNE